MKSRRRIIFSSLILMIGWLFLTTCAGFDSQPGNLLLTQDFDSALLTATFAVNIVEKPGTVTPSTTENTQTNTVAANTSQINTPTPKATDIAQQAPSDTQLLKDVENSPTAPPVPLSYESSYLNEGVKGYSYVDAYCEYLKNRWGAEKSVPGTVVMPIMYHSITGNYNELAPDGSQIHEKDLDETIRHAREVGFEAISIAQLVDFLENNAEIPKRSLVLILDDRRPGVARVTFLPYLEEYHWTLALSWLIGDTDTKPASYLRQYPDEHFDSLWEQMETYYQMGYFDIQGHGYVHNIPITEDSSEAYMLHEIVDSRKVLRDHFYCKNFVTGEIDENCDSEQPMAFVWPGGGFSKRAAEIAREAGYRIGFTVNPRGPVMYNWVPLASERNPATPSWLPEVYVDDPLMVLPRYWSSDAAYRIDDVIRFSKEAEKFAKENRADELAYYEAVCEPVWGAISSGQ